ncbi:hypothetical protein Mpsy_2734 [Methanolobus psychrophilus R15]|nr:hypothetical protein Mpsy_2734 [Methanolobus psychrophilus R15]
MLDNVKMSPGSLAVIVSEDKMDFIENDTLLFTLKVRSYRIYEGDSP